MDGLHPGIEPKTIPRLRALLVPALLFALCPTAQASNICPAANDEGEMYDCLQQQLKASDQALNAAYKTLIARYKDDGISGKPPTQDQMLKKAQLAWIALRDASCDFETYESREGSGFGTIHTFCLLEQTQKRVEYLNGLVGAP